jgi:hypothetical protein
VQTETRMDGVEEALRAEIDRAHTQVCTQENTLPRLELALFRATDNETYTAWNTSREWKLARPQVKRMRVSKSRRGDASNQRQRWSLMRRSFAVLWRGWLWQNDGVCPVTCKRLFRNTVQRASFNHAPRAATQRYETDARGSGGTRSGGRNGSRRCPSAAC